MKLYRYILMFFMVPMVAFGQSLDFSSGGGDIEINATNGVVWDRTRQEVVINENATMTQGDFKLSSDKITINYQKNADSYDVSLLVADDNVTITSAGEILTGDKAVFEPNKGIAILRGQLATLTSKQNKITAKVFEYYKNDNKAIARDNITLSSDTGVINSDIAIAYFSKNRKTANSISKIELFDNIKIDTGEEVVTGDKGVYNFVKGLIVIEGNVVIQKGKNHLKGDIGEVNLNTGISTLRSTQGKQIGGKVNTKKN